MMENKSKGEVLVVPYPMQGHVIPMMKLSENIASHGSKVTLVITEHNYRGMMSRSMIDLRDGGKTSRVQFVTVSDGLEPDDDRKDHVKFYASIARVMPGHVYDLVSKAKEKQGENGHFTCMVVSPIFGWAPKVADDLGIKLALFWTTSPGTLTSTLMVSELIKTGIIDQQGIPLKKEAIKLLSDFPNMKPTELPWYSHIEGTLDKKDMFNIVITSEQVLKKAKWVLCNWSQALIPSLAQPQFPNLLPIGPLLGDTQHNEALYPEDSACFTWLDQQPLKSVIYVAFGSFLSLTQAQINELAHGLELSGRRFLWALRVDMSSHSTIQLPDGFEARIANCGKLVEWASQEKVLAHPSIACFVTHCGWNSTIEGMSYGVPMLCWPCFGDQPYTRTCICEGWKIGLSLVTEDNKGVIMANDVRSKIDDLLSRQDLIDNSFKVKETIKASVAQGGSSFEAMQSFIKQAQF